MRTIKEILRLRWEAGLSYQAIAVSCRKGQTTVRDYLLRAQAAGLSWPLPEGMDEEALEQLLFPVPAASSHRRPEPDWATIHQELRRKGVTLALLWQEYKAAHPDGYQHSRFCQLYQQWASTLEPVLRQHYVAGEKLLVDYAGQTVPVVDRQTGEVRQAQIFVAVLGASNYTYVEATWTQGLADWIGSHRRCLEFLGGVPALIIPDNIKSGVTSPCFYDPDLNRSYQKLAEHYGTAVVPARIRRPRDKAKAEAGVQGVERWLLARLRHRRFFSLGELNEALRELLGQYNRRPFQKLEGCRESLFLSLDRPALKPLPAQPYEYQEWKKARVNIDYHVEVDRHWYSVPHALIRQQVEVCLSAHTVEILHRGKRVASHLRSFSQGRHTTVLEHMPRHHREYVQWSPQRLIRWAQQTGDATAQLVEQILSSRAHPVQGYRACLGILRLGRQHGAARLEAACFRALALGALTYQSIKSILKHGLENQPLPPRPIAHTPIRHAHIRGAHYYAQEDTVYAAPTDAGQTAGAEARGDAASLSGATTDARLPGLEL
ncbi:MAG: IS21 family transposase, partial [Armatimonadetes bacterium]|nr:IS21 family transposase [Armatimonadota bacterium]